MATTRRNIMMGAAAGSFALGLAAASSASAAQGAAPGGQILHNVYFWLKNPGSIEDRDALIAGLRTLAAIPVIRSLQIGVPASTEQRDVVDASFDVSEMMVFDSTVDQKAYQDHPIHLVFVEKYQHLWDKVSVYDTMTV